LGKFNDWLGDKLSNGLASMGMFYLITFLVVVPLVVERPNTFIGWIQYLSTAVLQASALPLLGYTTNKQGNIQSKLLQETHDTVMNELNFIKEEQAFAKEQRDNHSEEMAEIKLLIEEIHKQTFANKE
jgi:hypothetical protein